MPGRFGGKGIPFIFCGLGIPVIPGIQGAAI